MAKILMNIALSLYFFIFPYFFGLVVVVAVVWFSIGHCQTKVIMNI